MDNDNFQELVLQQLTALTEGQNEIQQSQERTESEINELRQSQVRMENELVEKVRALFDGREVSLDYFASIKNTLAKIEASQESVRNILYNLETKQREQDRELRLLRIEQK